MTTSVLCARIDAEPTDGSVVLDRENRAWQRFGSKWGPCQKPDEMDGVSHWRGWPWAHLLVEQGPVLLVHDAPVMIP